MNRFTRRLRAIFSFFGGITRAAYSQSEYGIKRGYEHRKNDLYFDDRESTDEFQKEVYELVKQDMKNSSYDRVIDVGCGSAFKLIDNLDEFESIGIDISSTYEFLLEKYPDKKWMNAPEVDYETLQTDVVVCADVIEHVLDPDEFLDNLLKIDFKVLYLSTPDRGLLYSRLHFGPPNNPSHIREWTGFEFSNYVGQKFNVISHQITHCAQTTQLIICTRK